MEYKRIKTICQAVISAGMTVNENIHRLYTGCLFHCYILDESIYHFKVSDLFSQFFFSISDGKSC